jgi:N-methylhydantoinase B
VEVGGAPGPGARGRKAGDSLTFDFSGTDPEVDGLINCTYAGIRGGIMPLVLTMLCGDMPWSPGGIFRCFDIVSAAGTINNANFPAGVGKASVASCWATQNAVTETLAGMLDTHPEHRKKVMSVCCGTWDLALLAGVDQREQPFVTMLCDAMAGGLGARSDMDGVDTGGLACIPMGRIADVEMNEFAFPMLYLWRREEIDSGGPGRFRGGLGASSCFIPYDTPIGGMHLVISAAGKAIPQATGVSGGYPGNSTVGVLVRGSSVAEAFAAGRVPQTLDELGDREYVPPELETDLAAGDVYYTQWQAGGGYGDPLLRAPALVASDVGSGKVTIGAARDVYGVAIDGSGGVDEEGTRKWREQMRADRKAEART